jgi:hypothetical protein
MDRENARLREIIANQSSIKNQLASKLLFTAAEFARTRYLELACEDSDGYTCGCCDENMDYHKSLAMSLKFSHDAILEEDVLKPVRHDDGSSGAPKY